jgi:hypothetical protein
MRPNAGWATASACGNGHACVEVAHNNALHGGQVLVRDSKQADDPDRVVLRYTPAEWMNFIGGLKLGYGAIHTLQEDGFVILHDELLLRFDRDEWETFMGGVHKGEFDIAPI